MGIANWWRKRKLRKAAAAVKVDALEVASILHETERMLMHSRLRPREHPLDRPLLPSQRIGSNPLPTFDKPPPPPNPTPAVNSPESFCQFCHLRLSLCICTPEYRRRRLSS